MKKLGVVVIIIGILMTFISGINIVTKDKVVDLGKVEISKEEDNPIFWSPFLGIVFIGTGILFIAASKRKSFD